MNDVGAQTAQHGRKRRWYGDVRPAAMLWLLLAGAMQPLAVAEPAQTVVDRSQVNAGQMDLCFLTNTCSVGGQSYTSKVGSCTASPGGDPSACEADGPASQSRTDAGSAAGNPIDVATGNKYQKEVDIAALPGVLGLEVVRHYNSRYAQGETKPGILGRGWKLSYETRLYRVGETLQIVQADGTRLIFNRDANNPSQCGTGDATHGRVVIEARGEAETYQWVWTHGASAGRRLYFDERGWLTRIEAPGGEAVSLEYTEAGLLSRVTDPQGRALKVHYPEEKTRDAWRFPGAERIETPAGEIKYSYGQLPEETSLPTYREDEPVQPTEVLTAEEQAAAKKRKSWVLANLERVEWPANGAGERSAVRIYHYEDERYPNLLTGISVAELGSKAERISRYGYDKQGLAKLSERLASGERVELTELAPSKLAGEPGHTVLTDGQGKSTSYRHAQIGGRGRLLETRGAGCPGCSPAERRYVYDTVGREVEVIQLDSSGRAESGVRKEYDDWGRLTGIGQVTYGAGAEAPQWHPLFGVWRLQQTEIQTSDETNEAERVDWLIRYDYAEPHVDSKTGVLLALEKPMRITRPSVVEGKEHRIELEYNDAWQVTKVIETGYSPAIPTNVAHVEPSIPESTDPADGDGFIKASTASAGLVGWEERSGSQQNSRDNLNSEASVGWAKQAQRSVPTRTAVTNQPEIPTRNTSTNTDGGFVGWEERSGSQRQGAADLVVAKSSGTNISKTTSSEGIQGNFVRAKCSGTLDSTGRSDCPRLITRTTEYRYRKVNGRSVLVAIDGPLPNGPLGLSTDSDIVRIFWDKQGDYPVRVFMPGGATRAFERDAAGRVVRVTGMPATGATNLAYERNGGLVSAYGDNGFGVSYEYDQFGRRVSSFVLEPGRRIPREHRVFDVSGRLVMEIGATGRINEAVYDEQGRLVISRVQSATYTQEERYDYDLSGRLIGVSDSTGAVRRILRDASGRAVGLIDPLGRMTRIDYDDRGRVRGVERGRAGGEGLRVDYGYDIHGHLVAVEQQGTALGRTERRVTRFVFDDFDRRVAEIDSQTGVVSRDYDESDRLVAERRADGDWSRYRYDPAGRLIYTATGVAGFPDEPYGETHYRYRDGRLVAVEHPEQREHYDYDARGRLVRKEMALRLDAGTWTNYAVVYRYDESGRLIGRSLSDGAELIFERNSSGQVVALKRRLGGWFGSKEQVLAQDLKQGLGGPEQLVYGNGVTGRWERSREGMLGRIRYSRPVKPGAALAAVFGAVSGEAHAAVWDPVVRNDALPGAWNYDLVSDTLHEERLVYDAAGNIAARRRIEAGGDRIKDQFYGYDAFDQLSVAANGRSEDEWNAETRFYFHDPLGDLRLAREGETRAYRETPVTYYDYDGAPMDKAGRQERMNDRRLVWDSLGRLAALEGKDGRIASYRYNHRHLRIAKKVGSRTVHHLYENRQRVADVDEAGRIKRHYIWLGDRLIALIDPEKARLPAAESKPDRDRTTYIHVNHLEAPVLATDEGGRIVWRAEYAPFGALVSLVDPSGLNLELRNPGQWSDAESGLYYNDRRYYDPKTGRYLSPDPLGLAGGDNRYAYAAANPLRWTDPFGLLLFAFDGTGNDETNPQTLSNVVRFREMYDEDERFYITGPGTLDPATGIKNPLYKGGDTADSGFSLTGLDRVAAMEGYLQRYANATDDAQAVNIDIVGFSRGAAQAREFANRIANNYRDGYYYYTDQAGKSRCQKVNLRFMGLFDTVLSTHTGNYNLAIPADFAYVAHAVALNEHRGDNVRASMPGSMGAFPLESILGSPGSYSSTRIEMGFLGAHSDIGGGFTEGELARVALVWMVNQAKAAGLQMAEGHIPKTIIANPVLHDKTTNQYSQTGRPDPDSRSTFEDRQVRYMGGATTTQIEMAGTVMTTADTYAFIHYNPAIDVSNWDEPPREVRIPGSEYSTGTVDMAGYLNWLNQHGYGIDLTVQ